MATEVVNSNWSSLSENQSTDPEKLYYSTNGADKITISWVTTDIVKMDPVIDGLKFKLEQIKKNIIDIC